MKNVTVRVDVTDPANVFVHKGWARKGHTYISFRTQISNSPVYWNTWRPGSLPHQTGSFMVPN